MAGTDSRFNAAQFRDAIKFAMRMGFPEETEKQLTWVWNPQRTFVKEDSGGHPFEFVAAQVDTEILIDDLIVDCAVTFKAQGGIRVGGTDLGVMDVTTITATLLDTDHDALLAHGDGRFPDGAMVDGIRYDVQFVDPPYGLFEVTVWDVVLQAQDES